MNRRRIGEIEAGDMCEIGAAAIVIRISGQFRGRLLALQLPKRRPRNILPPADPVWPAIICWL